MGRKRNIYIREYYKIENGTSTCKICESEFNGDHITNLKRHILENHAAMHEKDMELIRSKENNQVCDKKRKFMVQLSTEEVKSACLELVTKRSQAFSLLDCNAFKILTKQIFRGLNCH